VTERAPADLADIHLFVLSLLKDIKTRRNNENDVDVGYLRWDCFRGVVVVVP
jgi:hypothetical protein